MAPVPFEARALVAAGFSFPESPRWHEGALWFSDLMDRRVYRIAEGRTTTVCDLDDMPSGLGFLPDGRPLVVGMRSMKLWTLEGDKPRLYADSRRHDPGGGLNDMVVDGQGRAYIDLRAPRVYLQAGEESLVGVPPAPPTGEGILLIRDEGDPGEVIADALKGPNGLAVTPDGGRLLVAESFSGRIIGFDLDARGRPRSRSVEADLAPDHPDGICLDAEGAIWAGSPSRGRFLRILGGKVVASVETGASMAVACVLGGQDRRTLYMAVSDTSILAFRQMWDDRTYELARASSRGRIESVRVEVPGAGWP